MSSSVTPTVGAAPLQLALVENGHEETRSPCAGAPARNADVDRVWARYVKLWTQHSRGGASPALTKERAAMIAQRLRDVGIARVLAAVAGLFASPFNRGENGAAKRYLGIHVALRSIEQIEKYEDGGSPERLGPRKPFGITDEEREHDRSAEDFRARIAAGDVVLAPFTLAGGSR